jgi:hypothetical protein
MSSATAGRNMAGICRGLHFRLQQTAPLDIRTGFSRQPTPPRESRKLRKRELHTGATCTGRTTGTPCTKKSPAHSG